MSAHERPVGNRPAARTSWRSRIPPAPARPALAVASALCAFVAGCHGYKSDVTKLCDAEQLSNTSLKSNRQGIVAWMGQNVASAEGIHLVQDLETKDVRGIAVRLREEARRTALPSCALADRADLLANDEDFHNDMVNLCAGSALRADGSVARLDIADAEDAERVRELTVWTAANAKSSDTVAIVGRLAMLPPRQRGDLLRTESSRVGVQQCLMASALDSVPPSAVAVPSAVASFKVVKVGGPPKNCTLIADALTSKTGSKGIGACYAIALTRMPPFGGNASFELRFDGSGHVSKATARGSELPGDYMRQCLDVVMQKVTLDRAPPDGGKKGATANVTLLFTPMMSGEASTATVDPGACSG